MRLVREGGIERCQHRPVMDRHVENAAVRQFQSGSHPKFGEPQWLVDIRRREHDAGGMEIVSHRRALPYPHAADEHFGQRHGVHKHSPGCAVQQQFSCRLMMWISPVEMGNEDARVKCDHSGQSPRKSVR